MTAAHKIDRHIVDKITLMAYQLSPNPCANLIKDCIDKPCLMCDKTCQGYGNDPSPLRTHLPKRDRCCDDCYQYMWIFHEGFEDKVRQIGRPLTDSDYREVTDLIRKSNGLPC